MLTYESCNRAHWLNLLSCLLTKLSIVLTHGTFNRAFSRVLQSCSHRTQLKKLIVVSVEETFNHAFSETQEIYNQAHRTKLTIDLQSCLPGLLRNFIGGIDCLVLVALCLRFYNEYSLYFSWRRPNVIHSILSFIQSCNN